MRMRLLASSLIALATFVAACTKSTPNKSDTSIIGGRLADYHPFMVMISNETTGSTPYCGGTWIAEGVILTAAHCLEGISARAKVTVTAMNEDDSNEVNTVNVRTLVIHPDYNPSLHQAMHNDIALLFVEPLDHSALPRPVTPIALNTEHTLPETLGKVTAIGTGNESTYGSLFSGDLRQVEVPVIGTEQCKEADGYDRVWEHEICAGDMEAGGIDACQGDSGGPLIAIKDGRPVLVGIVSWGINCANKGKPGVYTRVSSFTSWIYEQIGRHNTAAGETAVDIAEAVKQHCYTGFSNKVYPYPDYTRTFEINTQYLKASQLVRQTNVPAIAAPKSTCSFNRSGLGNVRVDIDESNDALKMHVVLESGATWIADLQAKHSLDAECISAKKFFIELRENNSWLRADSAWYRLGDEVDSPDFADFETEECRINGTSVLFGQKKVDENNTTYMATVESSEISRSAKTYMLSKSTSSASDRTLPVTIRLNESRTEADFEIKNKTQEDIHTWSLRCGFKFQLTDIYGSVFESTGEQYDFRITFRNPSTIHGIIKNDDTIKFKMALFEDFKEELLSACFINGKSFPLEISYR